MSTKRTLREQYNSILAKGGKRLDDFVVFGWRFASDNKAQTFAIKVMAAGIPYEIMDAATKDAAVVASSGSEQALAEIAIQCAGEKFYPFID